MTREQMIEKLLEFRINLAQQDRGYLEQIFYYGYTGYEDCSVAELEQEMIDNGLVEDSPSKAV